MQYPSDKGKQIISTSLLPIALLPSGPRDCRAHCDFFWSRAAPTAIEGSHRMRGIANVSAINSLGFYKLLS